MVVQRVVAVVGPAFEPSVELGRDAAVGVRCDVVHVATGDRFVAAGGVFAVARAHFDGAPQPAFELRWGEMPTAVRGSANSTVSNRAVSRYGTSWRGGMMVPVASSHRRAKLSSPNTTVNNGAGRSRALGWMRSGSPSPQRGGAALRGGTCDAGGFVGQILLAHQAIQFGEERGAAERVEVAVETNDAVQHRRGMNRRRVGRRLRVVVTVPVASTRSFQ